MSQTKTESNQKILYRVINCSRHTARLKSFQVGAKKAGLNVGRIPCVDGSKFTEGVLCRMMKQKKLAVAKIDGESLTPIEVAISLSHLECWKDLLKSKSEYMVVFEDDAAIAKNFPSKLKEILKALCEAKQKWNIIWLYNGNWRNTKSKRKHVLNVGNISISKETVQHTAAATAYIITRSFARQLVNKIFPIRYPVDVYMGDFRGNMLTLDDKKKNMKCPSTPLIHLRKGCGGPGGTGKDTTQDYKAKQVHQLSCPVK